MINNPDGTNGWEGFGTEPAYGEITRTQQLARSAPIAGGNLSVGAINAPKKDQRQAAAATQIAPSLPTGMAGPSAAPSPAEAWAQIAAIPGISPLAADYASRA